MRMEEMKTDKLMLEHDILKLVKRFRDKYSSEFDYISIAVNSANPDMTMDTDGNCRTGESITIDIELYKEQDDDDE